MIIFNENTLPMNKANEIIKDSKENGIKYFIIYAHINKINNKMYIGQTSTSINERWGYFWKKILKKEKRKICSTEICKCNT